jgi:hypothetical protein
MTQNRSKPVSRDSSKKSPNHYENFVLKIELCGLIYQLMRKLIWLITWKLFSRNKKGWSFLFKIRISIYHFRFIRNSKLEIRKWLSAKYRELWVYSKIDRFWIWKLDSLVYFLEKFEWELRWIKKIFNVARFDEFSRNRRGIFWRSGARFYLFFIGLKRYFYFV